MTKKIFLLFIFLIALRAINAQVYVVKDTTVFYYDKIIKDADANSFDIINHTNLAYAKDKNYVYHKGLKTEYDVATFEIHEKHWRNKTYLSDKNDVYTYDYYAKSYFPIGSSSPKSYRKYNDKINIDNASIYWENRRISGSHSNSLEIISHEFFRDKNNVYYKDFKLPLDVNSLKTFISENKNIDFIGDATKIYSDAGYGHLMNTSRFKYINYNYVKDDKKVLYRDKLLRADATTFHVPNSKINHFAKDKYHDFYLGNVFPNRVPKKHLVNDDTFKSYFDWVNSQLKKAFSQNLTAIEKEPIHSLKELYTFPASNHTKIRKGKYIYVNEKPQPFIDAITFTIYNNDYAKDKNQVYLIYEYDDHVTFNPIKDVDPDSFSIIKEDDKYTSYCKDAKNVFIDFDKIEHADPNSFRVLTDDFGQDKNAVFYIKKRIPNLKSTPNSSIKKIAENYYSYGNEILFIDTYKDAAVVVKHPNKNNFKVINYYYALNGSTILYQGEIIGTLTENESILIERNHLLKTSENKTYKYGRLIDLKDKSRLRKYGNTKYLTDGIQLFTSNTKQIPIAPITEVYNGNGYRSYITFKNGKALYDNHVFDIDLLSFEEFKNSDFAKDKNYVYFKGKITKYDATTFHVFSRDFVSDKNGVYYKNDLIKEADTNSFNQFYYYGFDKKNFYFNNKIIPRSKINLKK